MTKRLQSKFKFAAPFLGFILSTQFLTSCVVKGSGSQRKSVAAVEGDASAASSEGGCLKVYEKRAIAKAQAALKLADKASPQGTPAPPTTGTTSTDTASTDTARTETAEETAACPAPADETPAALRSQK